MTYRFELIKAELIEKCFNPFYGSKTDIYFEIFDGEKEVGLYRIKELSDSVCEISLFIYNNYRNMLTKTLAKSCFHFPFSLKFEKVIISTELNKMVRFLKKMSKYGVKYITEQDKLHWFEVTK